MADVFNEVDEQVRSDRFRSIALAYLPWLIGGVVLGLLVAGGVYGWRHHQAANAEKASQAYGQGVDALGRGDAEGAFAAFENTVKAGAPAYKSLALMQEAGIRLEQNRQPDAVKLFDAAAAAAPSPLIGDAARLKSALALTDTAPYSTVAARLKPLMTEKSPYRAEAREAMAMAELTAGRIKDARRDFVALSLLADIPNDIRQRAQAAVSLIDSGSAAALPGAVKIAITLPPTIQPPGVADLQAAATGAAQ